MAKKETKAEIERTYNVPLRSGFRNAAKYKKTPKAMRTLKAFLAKHMKTEDIRIGMHLNEFIWGSGIRNPPHHVKVKAVKKEGKVLAELDGFEFRGAVQPSKKEAPAKVPEAPKEKPEAPKPEEKPKAEKSDAPKPKKAPAKKKAE